MAFRGQIGAGLPPVPDLLDLGDISSVSLPYLMSKEPVMRLEPMLTKLNGRLLRAVHWPCLDAQYAPDGAREWTGKSSAGF